MRPSAGTHAAKAVVLVAVAVVIGALLLHRNRPAPVTVSVVGTTTTVPRATPTTTAGPPASTATGSTAVAPSTTVPLRTPANVKVLVANGTTVSGLATRLADKLHAAGYNTLASTNTTSKVQATAVYYATGFQQEAAQVAQQVGAPAGSVKPLPSQVPVANVNGADVLVVAGSDIQVPPAAPPASAAATTTTAHANVTTTTKAATTTTKG